MKVPVDNCFSFLFSTGFETNSGGVECIQPSQLLKQISVEWNIHPHLALQRKLLLKWTAAYSHCSMARTGGMSEKLPFPFFVQFSFRSFLSHLIT